GDYKNLPAPTPRFCLDGASNTVIDNMTSLVWMRDGGATANYLWSGAITKIAQHNAGNMSGYSDWRLPNINEMETLINYGEGSWVENHCGQNKPFKHIGSDYWTSTTCETDTTCSLSVDLSDGKTTSLTKSSAHHLWAVRGPLP
ncbi:MAG TPA: DUF1566 domain-containing protein, partial [Spirochaetota bacterium]